MEGIPLGYERIIDFGPMNDTSILYGTDAAAPNQIFSFHDLSFTIEALSIKNICVENTEILREIAFLVRDADWGTVTQGTCP